MADPPVVYLPVVLERAQEQFRWEIHPNSRLLTLVTGERSHEGIALLLFGDKDPSSLVFAEPRQHRFGAHEGGRHHQLVAEHEAVDVEMMTVDLPAPRLARRRGTKDADPIEPFPVFLGLAGDFKGVSVEPHDVTRALVSRRAHGLLHEPERGLALIMPEIRKADAVPHQPRVDIRPFSPCRVVDRKARRLALLRDQLGEQGSSRPPHRRCRDAGSGEREESRDDPTTAYATKRLGKPRI